jgi:hypothetical protein
LQLNLYFLPLFFNTFLGIILLFNSIFQYFDFSSEANAKYDIQLTNTTGNDTTTILRGSISVLPEVTRL